MKRFDDLIEKVNAERENRRRSTNSNITNKALSYGFQWAFAGSIILGVAGCYSCIWEDNIGVGAGPWSTDFHFFGGLLYGFIGGGIIGALIGAIVGSSE